MKSMGGDKGMKGGGMNGKSMGRDKGMKGGDM
jgi:hypothetical protein